MKKIFLSADDLGRSPERNRAIDESFKNGTIKSAGLLVTGKYLEDAVNQINGGGYVKHVHCHFNLSGNINGEASLDKPLTPKLLKNKSFCKDGLFLPYHGHPFMLKEVYSWFSVYKELCAQYKKFLSVTNGKGNRYHVDFHLYYNLTLPVAIAFNAFTWTHRIKTARYIGVHYLSSRRMRLLRMVSWNPFVKTFKSGNIDYFLTKPQAFENDEKIELYCHPNYIDGGILDDSVSCFGHEKQFLDKHIKLLKERGDFEFVSWAE